ncbi:MAG TPA: hypothetical protein VMI94_05235 [Bryobacteraceae bacterium]|nr:hypothetical protein [Bryobacteraceae bacterium]
MRNWRNAFAVASCVSALLLAGVPGRAEAAKTPLLVLLGGDAQLWQASCAERGWQFLDPWRGLTGKNTDERIKALAGDVSEAVKRSSADPERVYLAAQGNAAAALFFVAARLPDVWAAAVAVGGSPRAAIDTNRLFAANTTNLPVLWLFANKADEPLGKKLQEAGFNLEWREAASAKPPEIFDWLAGHKRDPFPTTADCETGTPVYTQCYWIEVTRFDTAERNDVLDSTRVEPLGSNAALAIGPFGYDPGAAGPGVVVASLPEKYSGPLKVSDRIIELGGKPIRDAADFAQILYRTFEEKPVVVMVARGKEHLRLETKIVVPPRAEMMTARVRAQYLPDMHVVEVVSRAVTQMKLTLPPAWLPAKITWNGTEVADATAAGCWLLDEQKELLTARRCGP